MEADLSLSGEDVEQFQKLNTELFGELSELKSIVGKASEYLEELRLIALPDGIKMVIPSQVILPIKAMYVSAIGGVSLKKHRTQRLGLPPFSPSHRFVVYRTHIFWDDRLDHPPRKIPVKLRGQFPIATSGLPLIEVATQSNLGQITYFSLIETGATVSVIPYKSGASIKVAGEIKIKNTFRSSKETKSDQQQRELSVITEYVQYIKENYHVVPDCLSCPVSSIGSIQFIKCQFISLDIQSWFEGFWLKPAKVTGKEVVEESIYKKTPCEHREKYPKRNFRLRKEEDDDYD
ncbi:unnamed protein product [Lepeophtheirus salmonis]|uniref:(salmon louse) hypothetical protein n=1 Tax=Lepeophtheirus salmonis TaxID=72036 RepID=A0A7R8H2G0_LEPSM|nr:unnamed protein product [Lepeophtheirus salmonis]CAF2827882.1 unnamed protein product [Lepeophtheirus salmonis]